jgi:hypothetical protein
MNRQLVWSGFTVSFSLSHQDLSTNMFGRFANGQARPIVGILDLHATTPTGPLEIPRSFRPRL